MKKILFVFCLSFLSNSIFAQSEWVNGMFSPENNFFVTQDNFESFWDEKTIEKGDQNALGNFNFFPGIYLKINLEEIRLLRLLSRKKSNKMHWGKLKFFHWVGGGWVHTNGKN